jgi:hypothetical protein
VPQGNCFELRLMVKWGCGSESSGEIAHSIDFMLNRLRLDWLTSCQLQRKCFMNFFKWVTTVSVLSYG